MYGFILEHLSWEVCNISSTVVYFDNVFVFRCYKQFEQKILCVPGLASVYG